MLAHPNNKQGLAPNGGGVCQQTGPGTFGGGVVDGMKQRELSLNILVSMTDQPSGRVFELDFVISQRQKTYTDSTEALNSPIAAKLFGFPWVEKVNVNPKAVEVFKQDWVEWSVLEDPLKGLIEEHFSNYKTKDIEENPQMTTQAGPDFSSPEAQTLLKLIEDEINPALASHNGFVVLHGIENNQVYLEMGGGCQGCAMSYMTLKEGIENAIKNAIPTITNVVDVTNHQAGENPFFK